MHAACTVTNLGHKKAHICLLTPAAWKVTNLGHKKAHISLLMQAAC